MKKFIYQSKIHSNQSKNCLLMKEKKAWIRKLKNPKAFTNYSQTIDGVYENLQDYDPRKKRKVLIVFDDLIADMESNKTVSPIVPKLFLRGIKLNISLVFIFQSDKNYFTTHNFIMKVWSKREL